MNDINKNPLLNPFSNKILYTRVLVPCSKLNTDIYINLKNLLKQQIEGKCIKYGYVSKIFKILDYSNNTIDINNLDCSVFYNIKYSARLCFPIENTMIIARINTMNKQFFVAENGPITNMIKYSSLDLTNFKLTDDNTILIKKDNTPLVPGTFVKILIQAKKMYNNDNKIGTLSYLIDIAKPKEVNEFYEKKNLTEDLFDVMNFEDDQSESDDEYASDNEVNKGLLDNQLKDKGNNVDSENEEEESNTNFISI
jgi:DNA-directed RNA polymerase subunit E'/Rpb7